MKNKKIIFYFGFLVALIIFIYLLYSYYTLNKYMSHLPASVDGYELSNVDEEMVGIGRWWIDAYFENSSIAVSSSSITTRFSIAIRKESDSHKDFNGIIQELKTFGDNKGLQMGRESTFENRRLNDFDVYSYSSFIEPSSRVLRFSNWQDGEYVISAIFVLENVNSLDLFENSIESLQKTEEGVLNNYSNISDN